MEADFVRKLAIPSFAGSLVARAGKPSPRNLRTAGILLLAVLVCWAALVPAMAARDRRGAPRSRDTDVFVSTTFVTRSYSSHVASALRRRLGRRDEKPRRRHSQRRPPRKGTTRPGDSSSTPPSGQAPDPVVPAVPTGTAYFLSPEGSDTNPGTLNEPFGTFAHALQELAAGDVLYVRGGTYSEEVEVEVSAGEEDARVLVSNYPGERPVLQGRLWIGYPSFWTINGINVTWAEDNPNLPMVRIFGGTDWILQNSEIWGARSSAGLYVGEGSGELGRWTVRGNCIHDTIPTNGSYQDHTIYVTDTTDSPDPAGLIERNILFNATNGRGVKLGPGGDDGGAQNVVVRYNTIYNTAENVSLSQDTSNVRIYRNVLVKARSANIRAYQLDGSRNVAYDNIGSDAPALIKNDPGYTGIQDGGGNRSASTLSFDSLGCSGFRPTEPLAYGRHASG
jgi:hypothetical protein